MSDPIQVRVAAVRTVSPKIREFTLEAVSGQLFSFSPGSHVVVTMKGTNAEGKAKVWKNAYSLVSDGFDASRYVIAVRLQDESRGGSVFMHTQVKEGDTLEITPPSNLFAPVWSAKKHVLIAGGVGITPFMSYLPEMKRRGAATEMHYSYRGDATGAYREELQVDEQTPVTFYDGAAGERCDLKAVLGSQPLGTHFYVCGPESLIEGVQETAMELGLPSSNIHFEAFAAPQPGQPFAVQLEGSGLNIQVSEDESLLEALERSGVEVPNLCRGGVCGQCRTQVVDGEPEHRDSFLSDTEKADNDCLMPCVSRARSSSLTLSI
ncbi:MAG: oxidoreductase [Oceanospirillaceae bacterium]|nr:oxidoreductase [Oceanospirillaceae bacterium]|tara:strand:+ start:109 stop:1071 length:963 start_codon:yes stop_codon:yes gene_type:complete